jgi:hypothetical protein
MNFAQIAGALGDINLNWPSRAGEFMKYLGILDFDVDAIGPSCVFTTWSWQNDMYLQLLLPVGVLLGNKGQYLVAKLLLKLRLPRSRVLKSLGIGPANQEELLELQLELNMKVISFVNMVYITLVRYCVAAFVCSEVAPGRSALLIYPPLDCWTGEHQRAVVAASFGVLVYVVGFPLFVATTLMRVHTAQKHSDPDVLQKYGELYDRYEAHGFGYECMSIIRRGGFGCIGVFSGSPQMQCLAAQFVLTLQFVAQVLSRRERTACASLVRTLHGSCSASVCGMQVKLNPYVDSNLDIVETVLTLILLFIACCGMIFSAYAPDAGFESWQLVSLEWLTFISMVLGTLLSAALLANEAFELSYAWYLNREGLLGDTSADARHGREVLAYSKSATAPVHLDSPKKAAVHRTTSRVKRRTLHGGVASVWDATQRLRRRLHNVGVDDATQDEDVSSEDTKLFYTVNLLRFQTSMQRRDPSDRVMCAPPPVWHVLVCDLRV